MFAAPLMSTMGGAGRLREPKSARPVTQHPWRTALRAPARASPGGPVRPDRHSRGSRSRSARRALARRSGEPGDLEAALPGVPYGLGPQNGWMPGSVGVWQRRLLDAPDDCIAILQSNRLVTDSGNEAGLARCS